MKKLLLATFGLVSLFSFPARAVAHDCDWDHDRGRDYYYHSDHRDRDDDRYRSEDERRRHYYDGRCEDGGRRWEDHRPRGFRNFFELYIR